MSNGAGTIYLVATPIGNLDDMSPRAAQILAEVELIAAEDTRHSGKLLRYLGVKTPLISFHEHNEAERVDQLIESALNGKNIALISDAGTPLVSDPGFRLVQAAHLAEVTVSTIPGPCAAIAALTVSGLPTDTFCFRGFPPAKSGARQKQFESDKDMRATLIYYESPHRIVDSLKDMCEAFGDTRKATVARELTKKFETIKTGSLASLIDWISGDSNQQKGEFVVVVTGSSGGESKLGPEAQHLVALLAQELPPKKAAAIASEITGIRKKELYEWLTKSR